MRPDKPLNFVSVIAGQDHVFAGRYKAVLVDANEYLLELAAYIHLNPVRANITASAQRYKWSSHRAYLGQVMFPWLETDFILSLFSSDLKSARKAFAAFVDSQDTDGRRKEFHGEKNIDSRVFGSDDFVTAALADADCLPAKNPASTPLLL